MAPQITADSQGRFRVEGLIDLTSVEKLSAQGFALIEMGSDLVCFDLENVEIEGSAVLALLVSWSRRARGLGKEVQFGNPYSKLIAIAEAAGVRELLCLEQA